MASHHQQIMKKETASKAGQVRSFRERHLKCGAEFVTFSVAVWAAGRFGRSSRRNYDGGRRTGRASKENRLAVKQLTLQSYSDGLSVVYQMTAAEVRPSAWGAVSLSLSPCRQ